MSAAATIHVEVNVLDDDGQTVSMVGDEYASYEGTVVRNRDEFKKILGDGNARVSVSLSERMGGPYGYSSVSTNVTVTLNCNQDAATIRKAQEMAFGEAAGFTEDCFGKAMDMLRHHLSQHYRDE